MSNLPVNSPSEHIAINRGTQYPFALPPRPRAAPDMSRGGLAASFRWRGGFRAADIDIAGMEE
jgi:hypothetical protein